MLALHHLVPVIIYRIDCRWKGPEWEPWPFLIKFLSTHWCYILSFLLSGCCTLYSTETACNKTTDELFVVQSRVVFNSCLSSPLRNPVHCWAWNSLSLDSGTFHGHYYSSTSWVMPSHFHLQGDPTLPDPYTFEFQLSLPLGLSSLRVD